MTIAALGGALAHRLMAPFAGLVGPVLAQSGNLSTLGRIMTGDTALLLLDRHMFRVGEIYIAVLGGQADRVAAQCSSSSEHHNGNAEN